MSRARLLVAALATLAAAPAGAVTDSNFTYDAYKLGAVTINPLGLSPFSFVDFEWGKSLDNGGRITVSGGAGCLSTNVQVPNDAWLNRLDISYANVGSATQVFLMRQTSATAVGDAVISLNLSDNTGARRLSSIPILNNNNRHINNEAYTYGLVICLQSGDILYGARLFYHYNSAGD